MRFSLLLLLLLPLALPVLPQHADSSVQRLDSLLGEHCRVRIDQKSRLVIDHFEAGLRIGQDRLPLDAVDVISLELDSTGRAIQLRCNDAERCVERETFRDGLLKRSAHYALPVSPGDVGGGETLKVMRGLLDDRHRTLANVRSETR